MSERMDTVSVALPKWVNEFYEEAHWEVRMKKGALDEGGAARVCGGEDRGAL